MKKKYRLNLKTLFTNLTTAASVLLVLWFIISYIEVCIKNTGSADYSDLNALVLLVQWFGK